MKSFFHVSERIHCLERHISNKAKDQGAGDDRWKNGS